MIEHPEQRDRADGAIRDRQVDGVPADNRSMRTIGQLTRGLIDTHPAQVAPNGGPEPADAAPDVQYQSHPISYDPLSHRGVDILLPEGTK